MTNQPNRTEGLPADPVPADRAGDIMRRMHDQFHAEKPFWRGKLHLIALCVAIPAVVALLWAADGGMVRLAAGVYGASVIGLFAASSAYHLLGRTSETRQWLRKLEHSMIFVLIAGTYTPITLAIGGRVGWGVFATVWTMAALGIAATFRFWGRYRLLHVAFYVATGWSIVIAWTPVVAVFSTEMFGWVLAGGVTYTIGAVVYSIKRLPFNHAIWHLFVLGGSACFFVGIYRNILLM